MFEVTGVLRGTNKAGGQDLWTPSPEVSPPGGVKFQLHKAEWFKSTQRLLNFYNFTFPTVCSVKEIVLVDGESLLSV